MYEIPNFSLYFLNDKNEVIRKSDSKVMPIYLASSGCRFLRLKTDKGSYANKAHTAITALAKPPEVPDNFLPVPGYKTIYINKQGQCWTSPNKNYPLGRYLKIYYPADSKHYPSVFFESDKKVAVHKLLALTYIDPLYLEKGLCVLHKDNNKANFSLDNLIVGTYSENNKAAYADGLNPGNGFKK